MIVNNYKSEVLHRGGLYIVTLQRGTDEGLHVATVVGAGRRIRYRGVPGRFSSGLVRRVFKRFLRDERRRQEGMLPSMEIAAAGGTTAALVGEGVGKSVVDPRAVGGLVLSATSGQSTIGDRVARSDGLGNSRRPRDVFCTDRKSAAAGAD